MIKLNLPLLLYLLLLLSSCNGQSHSQPAETINIASGKMVSQFGGGIMVIYQDKKSVYWFGSWDSGVYRYDGKSLINYTTEHGLSDNRIDEIKEDSLGNMYFSSFYPSFNIVKFDGKTFQTITPTPSEDWRLNSADLWFKHSYDLENFVYRYDGKALHQLQFPNPPNYTVPFAVYSIYKDLRGNLWFGTNPVGVCRYDGKSFDWITEEDVTEFRNEGANGVRSIAEDKHGDFWFNTENRYSVYDSLTLASTDFYTRHQSIGGLDGKIDSQLDEYLSVVKDNDDNLWFVTYRDGVWMYDGEKVTHFEVQDQSENITLFSIYKDHDGALWLGTHANGVYKFNGKSFEKFALN